MIEDVKQGYLVITRFIKNILLKITMILAMAIKENNNND